MTENGYLYSVPLTNDVFYRSGQRKETVGLLKRMKVGRVFLCIDYEYPDEDSRAQSMKALKENSDYLHENGFETGAWFWSLMSGDKTVTMMTAPDGRVSKQAVCPTDGRHRKKIFSLVCECAKTGVDMIMFDDDFRYGFHDIGFGCLCENHRKMIGSLLGEEVDAETLKNAVLTGGKNRYRDAFIKANGMALEIYAEKCREALDKVAPQVRLGFCSCITSWDIDGTTPDILAEKFAGKTRPFYRLIGAPYWAALRAWGHDRLSFVIEQERLEASRRKNKDIEIFSEGDTFPRPRYRVPAAFLEGFDTALRADGSQDGILKYSFDYAARYDYETGYNDAHLRNLSVYETIDRMFGGKTCDGVRVIDKAEKFADIEMPADEAHPEKIQEYAFSASARFLACCSVPAVYSGPGVTAVAFGEDAKAITPDDMKNGLILDLPAAEYLQSRGIDTGIAGLGESVTAGERESFADGTLIGRLTQTTLKKTELKDSADVLSSTDRNGEALPVCWFYENENGQRFVVYAFDAYKTDTEWFRSYARQKQVIAAIRRLGGKPLPAVCAGHPDLYSIVKRNGGEITAGLWNFCPDAVYDAPVVFGEEIASAEIYGAKGCFSGNTVTLERIEPYGFAAVTVRVK